MRSTLHLRKVDGRQRSASGMDRGRLIALLLRPACLIYGCDYLRPAHSAFHHLLHHTHLVGGQPAIVSGIGLWFALLYPATSGIDLGGRTGAWSASPGKAAVNGAVFLIAADAGIGWARDNLQYEASRDPLTGAFNRQAAFFERIDEGWGGLRGRDLPLSLAFIDLDNFKHINDSQGHEGDES